MPLASIEEAIAELRAGRFAIIVDDPRRENEGDLCLAAQLVTPEAVNFMAREGRGLICVAMDATWVDRLGLPPMVPPGDNTARFGTAFTASVEAREGVTTGISAYDRAVTISKLADPEAARADFVLPGHVFPLRAREDGVLARAGQTEASVDLMRLAGLRPVAVICEIMAADGTMARLPELERFGAEHGIKIVTVADLVAYRRSREPTPHRVADTLLPTAHGVFRAYAYQRDAVDDIDLALALGDVSGDPPALVRVHSECLTGEALGSLRCDCGAQLTAALAMIGGEGRGALLYLRQEGRGIGLLNKLRAYHLQDQGLDTVEANRRLGLPDDARDYRAAAVILRDLGIRRLRLLTNNPRKVDQLAAHGLDIAERVPLVIPPNDQNRAYLRAKQEKLGHLFGALPDAHVLGRATHLG